MQNDQSMLYLGRIMKKTAIIMMCIFCVSLIVPLTGEAGGYYHHGGCYGGCGSYWVPAAIVGGTILAGALIIGAMSQPPRPPAQPAYRPIDTSQPYASPDPSFVAQYGQAPVAPPQQTAGQWITVPAQQVGGIWVPSHRVFVPNS
jgi:hypothetical protein